MSTPAYTFRQRDAAQLQEPKRFVDALTASGRFYRDERNLIQFKVGDGDYMRIETRGTLRELLLSGDVLKLDGDIDASAFECMWLWLVSRKWALPRLYPERPRNPDKPAPVSRTGNAFVRRVQS